MDSNPTQDQNAISRPRPITPPATPLVDSAVIGFSEVKLMPSGLAMSEETAIIVRMRISETSTTPSTLAATEMSKCESSAITSRQLTA